MISFSASLTPDSWTEILDGNSYIAFDSVAAKPVELYFNESASAPADDANGVIVLSFPASWDYEGIGMEVGKQRVWARGKTDIRGVRG